MSLLQKNNLFDGVNLGNALQNASRSIGEVVSGLTNQLVNPFKTVGESVESGVALVSETDSRLMANLSTYKSTAIDGISTSLKNITGGFLNAPDLGRIISYRDGFKVNTDELLRIGSKGLGFNINSMQGLKQQLGDAFIAELDSMTGGLSQGLFYADGTKLGIADDWQFTMGNTLIDFMGKDDGAFGNIVNLAGVNSILNVMVQETVRNGMYDGFGTYKDQYMFFDDYRNSLINSLDIAIGRGDIKSIERILEIIEQEGVNQVRAKYPDLIERMLSGFYFSTDSTPADYPEMRDLLVKVCVTFGGPDWYKTHSWYGMATNMALVNYISPDAKLLLEEVPELIPLLAGAGVFMDTMAREVFLVDFPKAVSLT